MKTFAQLVEETQIATLMESVTDFDESVKDSVLKTHIQNDWKAHDDVFKHLASLEKEV